MMKICSLLFMHSEIRKKIDILRKYISKLNFKRLRVFSIKRTNPTLVLEFLIIHAAWLSMDLFDYN